MAEGEAQTLRPPPCRLSENFNIIIPWKLPAKIFDGDKETLTDGAGTGTSWPLSPWLFPGGPRSPGVPFSQPLPGVDGIPHF